MMISTIEIEEAIRNGIIRLFHWICLFLLGLITPLSWLLIIVCYCIIWILEGPRVARKFASMNWMFLWTKDEDLNA